MWKFVYQQIDVKPAYLSVPNRETCEISTVAVLILGFCVTLRATLTAPNFISEATFYIWLYAHFAF